MNDPDPTAGSAVDAAAGPGEVRSWGWHLMQVSAWLLLVLLPVHVLTTWVVHDPGRFGVGLYVDRWHHSYWRVFDWLLLVLGLVHGGIGINALLGGMARRSTTRTTIAVVLAVLLGLARPVRLRHHLHVRPLMTDRPDLEARRVELEQIGLERDRRRP